MSWKNRNKKKFYRLVHRLQYAPIFLMCNYVFIDADIIFQTANNNAVEIKSILKSEFILKQYKDNHKINSLEEFDNYFNPSLTLDLCFERSRERADKLKRQVLEDIGYSWKNKLVRLGLEDGLLFLHYDKNDGEWTLEFLNSMVAVDYLTSVLTDVVVFLPEQEATT